MDSLNNDETEYFRRREQQERDLAESASSPDIRGIHVKFAEHYAQRVLDSARTAG